MFHTRCVADDDFTGPVTVSSMIECKQFDSAIALLAFSPLSLTDMTKASRDSGMIVDIQYFIL